MENDARPGLAAVIARRSAAENIDFHDEDVREGALSGLYFRNCRFHDCRFDQATLSASTFTSCLFERCTFREAELSDCKFYASGEATACTWRFCDVSEAVFSRCNLTMNKLVRCKAYKSVFEDCAAQGLTVEADIHRGISKKKTMSGLTFRGCKLQFGTFTAANYAEAVFERCDIRDVNFAGSNLARANFRGSVMHNADFTGATLDEADLTDAEFDAFALADVFSYQGMVVSRAQQEVLLAGIGIKVAG